MNEKEVMELLKFIFGKNPIVILAAMVGGIGIVNVIDSIITVQLSIQWALVPDWLRPIFTIIREWWQWLIDPILACLPFNVSDPMKDYMLMGFIVAGMRLRSSMVIWKDLKDLSIESYTQRTIIPGYPIILRRDEKLKFIVLFLPFRIIFAFFAWPIKLFGAAWRYGRGEKREGASDEQYRTFFGSIFWSVFIVFVCLVFRF